MVVDDEDIEDTAIRMLAHANRSSTALMELDEDQ